MSEPGQPNKSFNELEKIGDDARPEVGVFISYSRSDGSFAEDVLRALANHGVNAYIDKRDIAPAEDWRQRLADLIAASEAIVFILTPASAGSEVCAWEVAEAERLGKRIITLLHREPGQIKPPSGLARLNYIFAREGDSFSQAIEFLAEAIFTDISWVREHTRLGSAAEHWRRSAQSSANILRGDELARAEAWLAMKPAACSMATNLQQDYIETSRRLFDDEEEERKRTLRRFLDNQARFLADRARARLLAGDPIEALVIALEGLPDDTSSNSVSRDRPVTPETFSVLCEAIDAAYNLEFLGEKKSGAEWGAFARGGKQFAAASKDGVTLWKLDPAPTEIARFSIDIANHIAFCADGSKLAICWRNSRITVHETKSGAQLHCIETPLCEQSAFDWSGNWLAAKGEEDTELWKLGQSPMRVNSSIEIANLTQSWFRPLLQRPKWIKQPSVRISVDPPLSDRKFVIEKCQLSLRYKAREAISNCGRFAAQAFEHHNGALIFKLGEDGVYRDIQWLSHDDRSWREIGVSSLTFSADGLRLLTGSYDTTARIWDVATGNELQRFEHPDEVVSAQFSSNEQFVITYTAKYDADRIARLFVVGSGAEIEMRCGEFNRNHLPTINANGDLLLSPWNGRPMSFPDALSVTSWITEARSLCHSELDPKKRTQELYLERRPGSWYAHQALAPHIPASRMLPAVSRGEQGRYAREATVQAGVRAWRKCLKSTTMSEPELCSLAAAIESHFNGILSTLVNQNSWMSHRNLGFELAAELFVGMTEAAKDAGKTDVASQLLKSYRGPSTPATRALRDTLN